MEKVTSIGIGLHIGNGQVIDLQIPNRVTGTRLKQLLRESLELMHIQLPEQFNLTILNKPITLDDAVLLANYALGDGDQVAIQEQLLEQRGNECE